MEPMRRRAEILKCTSGVQTTILNDGSRAREHPRYVPPQAFISTLDSWYLNVVNGEDATPYLRLGKDPSPTP